MLLLLYYSPIKCHHPWMDHHLLSIERAELCLSEYTPLLNSLDFPTLSPLPISSSVVASLPPPTIEIPPVLSINVPIYCHYLCLFPSPAKNSTLVTAITDLHLIIPFNYYFNNGCLYKAWYKTYLQVKCFSIIISPTEILSHPSSSILLMMCKPSLE